MIFEVENKQYEILIASDIHRDGLGCELWDIETNQLLMEIFRSDMLKKIQYYSVEINLPFEVIEKLLEVFEKRVGRDFQE
jgi:hypothetical protein